MERKEGRGRPGAPKSQEQGESKERQALPNVWNLLERLVNLKDRYVKHQITSEAHDRERRELVALSTAIDKKGAPREKLISALYDEVTIEPGNLPVPVYWIDLSPEEFQKFRSKVEPLSNKEIREQIRKRQDENKRKFEEAHKNRSIPSPLVRV
jgi:hypothetical protein